ncbi:hypothetical protein CONCODRAFT_12654 [Conidiobolus coronatus NRRL 28638]|uniref:G-protein coupled receptors family 1 profile domain-containing protein n=1 Tax=Conidiobolus coronatus (strain ATCC 28846 / CBS 209.66 / NRRL 28638) TaxID=796925 RepID=A0A137NSF0_CONC2|nr:hypothetical protein CONCODRAFT_12654 [Conidiobolus coronatus NRRL 28638]|eukprot:KXN65677.1 hypothetical protein CONCODRAFT_12654 [Conidiobolus coronatus NRRL 28638]
MNSTTLPEMADSGNKYSGALRSSILTLDILEVTVGIIAVLINSLAIYILTTKLKLKQSDTVISFIVSIFDITFSIFTIINCLILWITNRSAILFTLYSQFNGYLFFCLGACVVDSITLLSLIRYLAICKQVKYSNKFWVKLILVLVTFNFMFGLIPLIQNQFKVQPSLKYSSVEFNTQNNWSINFHYCFIWTKLAINMVIITVCYFFISLFYYNYLKNYNEEVEESEKLPNIDGSDLSGNQFDTSSIQLELDKENNCHRNDERKSIKGVCSHIIDNSTTPIGVQPDFHSNYTIDNLIRTISILLNPNHIQAC